MKPAIQYTPSLRILNLEQLPKGSGAPFLECYTVDRAVGGECVTDLVAVQWRRRNRHLAPSRVMVRFLNRAPVAEGAGRKERWNMECQACKPGFYTFAAVETHDHNNKAVPCGPGCSIKRICYLCGDEHVESTALTERKGEA